MAGWAAEWGGAKDVFKDATKMDKPENVKKVMGIITVNSSNISAALKKVDGEFKKHDAFLKAVEALGPKMFDAKVRDKAKASEDKVVAATKSAVAAYETAAKAYTPKLKSVIDQYKADKQAVKDRQKQDERDGKTLSPQDIANLKTTYVRGIQLLDKQLASITAGIAAELEAFQKKCAAARTVGSGKAGAQQAADKTALPLARAAVKKALAFTAQAKAVVGGAYEGKDWEPARLKAFQKLKVQTFADTLKVLDAARKKGLQLSNDWNAVFNPNDKRWQVLINDTALLDHALSTFAKDLKELDKALVKNNP